MAASVNAVAVDTAAPTVSAVAISGTDSAGAAKAGTLAVGDKIKVAVTMSEATTVTGTPTYTVDVGGQTKTASYVSGSGSTSLVFEYVVSAGDTDSSGGITALANALALGGGTLKDAAGNSATLNTPTVAASANAVVVDATPPVLTINTLAGNDYIEIAEKSASLSVTGTAEASRGVTVTFNGTSNTVTADASGNWTTTFSSGQIPANGGLYTVSASQTDAVGNIGSAARSVGVFHTATLGSTISNSSSSFNVTVPSGMTLSDLVAANFSGKSAADGSTDYMGDNLTYSAFYVTVVNATSSTVQMQAQDGGFIKGHKLQLDLSGTTLTVTKVYTKFIATTAPAALGVDFDTNGTVQTLAGAYALTNFAVQLKPSGTVGAVAPVVLDLDHNGTFDYSVLHLGGSELSGWVGPKDGILAWDENGNGGVDGTNEYAFTRFGGATDLEGLRQGFDTNGDGVFDARDDAFEQFVVWRDSNQNGISDNGEVFSLAELGIDSINLTSDAAARSADMFVQEAGQSSATLADGSTMAIADAALRSVAFAGMEGRDVSIMTQPGLFHGTARDEFILGTAGNDTIAGGGGNDVLYGRRGGDATDSNLFVWNHGDAGPDGAVDRIGDFVQWNGTAGDRIDLTRLLEGYRSGVSDLSEWITSIATGATVRSAAGGDASQTGTLITIDIDGVGAGTATQQIFLTNVALSSTDLATLQSSGVIVA